MPETARERLEEARMTRAAATCLIARSLRVRRMSATDRHVLGPFGAYFFRLARRAALIDPITRRFYRAAGIVEGMRVLDVGSGAGDTALLLAGLVGSAGAVVGVDGLAPPTLRYFQDGVDAWARSLPADASRSNKHAARAFADKLGSTRLKDVTTGDVLRLTTDSKKVGELAPSTVSTRGIALNAILNRVAAEGWTLDPKARAMVSRPTSGSGNLNGGAEW